MAGLVGALTGLRNALRGTALPLDLPLAKPAAQTARQLVEQLDDYVLPRLQAIEAPLLVVVGGSTGAGKSTLVNSLVSREVSAPGVIRPTTRSPVLVLNPADEAWFSSTKILPGLTRTFGPTGGPNQLRLVTDPSLPAGLAILDAPDIDSIVDENRVLASQLMDAGDLWLFVTSAARYGDAVPWRFLADASARSAAVAIVLDRVPESALSVVPDDLRRLMTEGGLANSPLFVVPETRPGLDGLLPEAGIAPIRTWLGTLAASSASRRQVVLQTLDGAITALAGKAVQVADAADEQVAAYHRLEADAISTYREAERAVSAQASDGSLLRGEVLARWHEYVGTTAFFRVIDEKVSWLRDKITAVFRQHPDASGVKVAAEVGLQALIVEAAEQAASRAEAAWQATPPGRALLATRPDLGRASSGFAASAYQSVTAWQADVFGLVSQEGAGRRQKARLAAAGVNGVGACLMLVIFASTGGLTGAEIGIAGGTTVVAQKLLESVFGDEAVRRLAATAKANLIARIDSLLAGERARYMVILDGLGLSMDGGLLVDQAIDEVTAQRAGGYDIPEQPEPEPKKPSINGGPMNYNHNYEVAGDPPMEETTDLMEEALQPTTALPISEAAALAASMIEPGAVSPSLPLTPNLGQPTEPPPAWLPRIGDGGQ